MLFLEKISTGNSRLPSQLRVFVEQIYSLRGRGPSAPRSKTATSNRGDRRAALTSMTNPSPLHEESFQQVVSNVEDHAIFLLTPEGYITSWNTGAARILGYQPGEIIGKNFAVFYSREDVERGAPIQDLDLAQARVSHVEEGWRVRSDGSKFWAHTELTAIHEKQNQLRGFLQVTQDLTERQEARAGLRQSEDRFRRLVEGVQEYAIFMLDPKGNVATWNRGAQRMKGYQAEEIIGRHFSCFYTPEALEERLPERNLRVATRKRQFEGEGWRVRRDGRRFWASVLITALFDENGALEGFAKVTRDLSEKRQIEVLAQADQHKDEFLAVLAHELRNPLAPISNALYLTDQPNVAPGELARAMEGARRQARQMARLLDDLLDLTRIGRGLLDLNKERIDVRSIMTSCVESIRRSAGERRQELTIELLPDPVWVEADAVRLEQVVTNLLTNAISYTDDGGQIRVVLERERDEVVIRVIDTGIGIERDELARIFTLFVRGRPRHGYPVAGTGIGLALVKRLVEAHGGKVSAVSEGLGKGSEFIVRLPAPDSKVAAGSLLKDKASASSSAISRRVLVVDDNQDLAESLALVLKTAGHEVRVAKAPGEVFKIMPAFSPEVVILDIGLPEMDGYELCRRMREQFDLTGVTLIALTGWGQMQDLQMSKRAGFQHHLVKPVDPGYLISLLGKGR
jgi:PAS domain S-box-containing protein